MKNCNPSTPRIIIILAAILLHLTLIIPQQAYAADEPFETALKFMKEGRYLAAENSLKTAAKAGKVKGGKLDAYLAVINYQKPDWYSGDTRDIKITAEYSLPLIRELIEADPLPGKPDEEIDWIIKTKTRYIELLAELKDPQADSVFMKLLKDNSGQIRIKAVEALREAKTPGSAESLYKFLKTERPMPASQKDVINYVTMEEAARAKAVEALVNINDSQLIPELKKDFERLSSPDRRTAAIILTGMRSESLRDLYIKMLSDVNEEMSVFAAAALKDMGDARGFDILKRIFKKEKLERKLWCFRILKQFKSEETARFFMEYLDEESTGKAFGHVPLTNLGKVPSLAFVSDHKIQLVIEMIQTLMSWTDISPAICIRILKNHDGNLRYIAAEILAETLSPEGIPVFRELLHSTDPLLVYFSLWGLGRLGDTESIPEIKKFLTNEDDRLKSAAAWTLTKLGSQEGYPVAAKLINSSDPVTSATALDTLCICRKNESADSVHNYLFSKINDPLIQRKTIILSGAFNSEKIIQALTAITQTNAPNAYYAAESLYRITGEPRDFTVQFVLPDEVSYYGINGYRDIEFIRLILLYLSENPRQFGRINELTQAFTKKIPHYGEFGKKITVSSTNPLRSKPEPAAPAVGELNEKESVLVTEYRGRFAKVITADGKTGWVLSAGLEPVDRAIKAAKRRLRIDFGYRWPSDLNDILKNNYLKDADIKLTTSRPPVAAAYNQLVAATALAGYSSGIPSLPELNLSLAKVFPAEKIVTIKSKQPRKTFELTFNMAGTLERIKVK